MEPTIWLFRFGVFCVDTSPEGWMVDVTIWFPVQSGLVFGSQLPPPVVGGGLLPIGAPRVLKSTPEDAVESLEATVLLMKLTLSASWMDTPAPSQPATLLLMMLLVTLTLYQLPGFPWLRKTSVPLTFWRRIQPPLPLSAV